MRVHFDSHAGVTCNTNRTRKTTHAARVTKDPAKVTCQACRKAHHLNVAPKVEALDWHRNGICGEGFYAAIVRDTDGSEKVVIRFTKAVDDAVGAVCCAVLDLGVLAEREGPDRIAFGINSWRGDHYSDLVDAAIAAKDGPQ